MFATATGNRKHRLPAAAGLAGAIMLFAGCTTAPIPPTAALNEADLAIQNATKDDARQYAAAELDEARQSLMLANKAVTAEDMVLAERYAQESIVTARLAAARSEATKAEAVNEDMRRSGAALIEEMRRTGEQQ